MKFLLIILTLSLCVGFFQAEVQEYICEGVFPCDLTNLNLTAKQKKFKIKLEKPLDEVVWVRTWNSKIEVLDDSICDALPLINSLVILSVGLELIDENAFAKCKEIEKIELESNRLTDIPSQVFAENHKLKVVDLSDNNLKNLDENLFINNNQLRSVGLRANQLSSLPSKLFKNLHNLAYLTLSENLLCDVSFLENVKLEKLKGLYLTNNNLTDIPAEKFMENFPNLQILRIDGNDFWCERLKGIKNLSKDLDTGWLDPKCIKNKDTWKAKQTENEMKCKQNKQQVIQKLNNKNQINMNVKTDSENTSKNSQNNARDNKQSTNSTSEQLGSAVNPLHIYLIFGAIVILSILFIVIEVNFGVGWFTLKKLRTRIEKPEEN